jgi:demethylmenaquinone methyltransferase/2-methoxy-6-polyprenyl-1,4-benzoquinol methylase
MTTPRPDQDSVDFGFRAVPRPEKQRMVRQVFDSVAQRYDVMNDLMSLGVHRLWKDAMVDLLKPRPGWRVLDMAGGTGDIAFRLLDRAPGIAVSVADINERMLSVGRDRAIDQGRLAGLDWVTADAERLPFAGGRFDAYTIAFGIRNVTDKAAALAEAHRVLRPGGRFLCLEFSAVTLPGFDRLYDAWSFQVMPRLGARVAGDADAYRYLAESIRRFPDQPSFAAMIERAGFRRVSWRNLTGGIAALHAGWKV